MSDQGDEKHFHRLSRRAFLKDSTLFLAGSALLSGDGLLAATEDKPVLRLGLITDLHYADKDSRGTRHYRESLTKVAEAAKRFREDKPDLLVHVGDLIDSATSLDAEKGYRLRWFTPKVEVALCGHATLASAHVLWSEGHVLPAEEIHFHTKSGLLKATRKELWIELDFPVKPPTETSPPPGLLEALGTSARYVGRNQFDYLVEVESEDEVRRITPDFARLSCLEVRGVIVTSISATPQHDFVSRFFAPRAGVNEDPVTGSAHCCLGPYWQGRLGKSEFAAFQASARGGVIRVRVVGDRTFLGGQAVTMLRGELVA